MKPPQKPLDCYGPTIGGRGNLETRVAPAPPKPKRRLGWTVYEDEKGDLQIIDMDAPIDVLAVIPFLPPKDEA